MSQPRTPSIESEHEDAHSQSSARRHSRNRRGRSRTPRSLSASSEEENYDQPPRRRRKPQNKGALPAVDELQDTVGGVTKTATGAVDTIGNTAGALTGGGEKKKDDTLSLRLDLNLDVYVKLKAKVHGDLTLTLL
jgi:hypothetical protein